MFNKKPNDDIITTKRTLIYSCKNSNEFLNTLCDKGVFFL